MPPSKPEHTGTSSNECEIPQIEMKVVMIGNAGVGKTSLALRYVKDTYRDNVNTTFGASLLAKTERVKLTTIENGCTVPVVDCRINVWDTAGQEQFQSIVPVYFRQAHAVIVVIDITSPASLNGAKSWLQQVRTYAPEDVHSVLVVNKCDAPVDTHTISEPEVNALADTSAMKVFYCSAKRGTGVREVFLYLAQSYMNSSKVLDQLKEDVRQRSDTLYLNGDRRNELASTKSKKSCCGL